MTHIETALRYMDILFGGGPASELLPLLEDDFRFEGPLFECASAREYVDAMTKDPPEGFAYSIISVFEKEAEVGILFEFTKGEIRTPMFQRFRFRDTRIRGTLLVFDARPFG